jgi:hypothetical protein
VLAPPLLARVFAVSLAQMAAFAVPLALLTPLTLVVANRTTGRLPLKKHLELFHE